VSRSGGARVVVHETASVEETMATAARLARELPGGAVVHLTGPLGAGKTHFVKGLAQGLGLDPDDVVSPTFTLVHEHPPAAPGGRGLVHVDLYRLGDPSELFELGLTELPGPDALAAVEWPERLPPGAERGAVVVAIEDLGGDRRRLTVRRRGAGEPAPAAILR
jgi:tRNA threonylcarbamoyladenosine biosynthesis protein TsaE